MANTNVNTKNTQMTDGEGSGAKTVVNSPYTNTNAGGKSATPIPINSGNTSGTTKNTGTTSSSGSTTSPGKSTSDYIADALQAQYDNSRAQE